MSVGAVQTADDEPLFTDEGQVAPGVTAVAPPIEAGGSSPSEPPPGGVAQPADIPGGQLNTDQLMAASTGAPNPQGDAVDQVLAQNPGAAGSQAPAAPASAAAHGATPAVGTTPGDAAGSIQQQELAGLNDQTALSKQGEDVQNRLGGVQAKIAQAEDQGGAEQESIAREYQARENRILNDANTSTQHWVEEAQKRAEAYQGMKLHDYWSDKTTLSKVLAGIAIALGSYGGGENPGLQIVNGAIERDFRMQQQAIEKAKGGVEMAQGMVAMGLSAKQQALADNNLKKAAAYDAAAAKMGALKLAQGVPVAQIQNDQAILALRGEANKTRMQTLQLVHQQNLDDAKEADAKEKADAAMLRAQKYKTGKGAGAGGGGGSSAAFEAFTQAAGQLKPGEPPTPQVVQLALKAGIKKEKIADQVNKYRGSSLIGEPRGKGAAGAAGTVDPKLIVHDVSGKPIMLASSARAVPALQSDIRTLTQAKEQLQTLRNDKGTTTRSPKFHDAVLALAAVTTAGKTDTTTEHEKGTLLNSLGIVSNDAIDTKLAQVTTRLDALKRQGNPLPEGYRQVPDAVIEKAKQEVRSKGPNAASAQKLLDQQGITVL